MRFFAPQGRLVGPIQVKLGTADGHLGPLGCVKFHVNRRRGGNAAPKYEEKIPLFGKESPLRGGPFDRFLKYLRPLIRPTILHWCFKFDVIRFTSYGVIAEKPRVGHLREFFHAPCRKNYALDRKMIDTFFDGLDELYHHAEFGEDCATRAGCRCENVVFVCFLFVCNDTSRVYFEQLLCRC